LPDLWLIGRCIREAIQLHDLCTLACGGIIAECLPLEADLSEAIFDVWVSLHLPGLIRYVVQLDPDMSDVYCAPYVFNDLLHGLLQPAHIQSAYVADEASELPLRCVVHIKDGDALGLFGARDRQLDEVALVALGLFRDEVIIVIEGEGLL
jgi:hypothetical protein